MSSIKSTNGRAIDAYLPVPSEAGGQAVGDERAWSRALGPGGAFTQLVASLGGLAAALGLLILVNRAVSPLGGDGATRLLAALAGGSAWIYAGLALMSSSLKGALAQLLVAVLCFAMALASVGSSAMPLAWVFAIHGLWGAAQLLPALSSATPGRFEALAWSGFHMGLAVLLFSSGL